MKFFVMLQTSKQPLTSSMDEATKATEKRDDMERGSSQWHVTSGGTEAQKQHGVDILLAIDAATHNAGGGYAPFGIQNMVHKYAFFKQIRTILATSVETGRAGPALLPLILLLLLYRARPDRA